MGKRQSSKNVSQDVALGDHRRYHSVDYDYEDSPHRQGLHSELYEMKKNNFEKYKAQHLVPDQFQDPSIGLYGYNSRADPLESKMRQVNRQGLGTSKIGIQHLMAPLLNNLEKLLGEHLGQGLELNTRESSHGRKKKKASKRGSVLGSQRLATDPAEQ